MRIGEYDTHPAADLFLLMEGEEFAALVADVRAHGLREAIWLCEDKILDGRNRMRACVEAGVEPRFRLYEGDDPIGFVLSLNLHRRHLSESQRSMVGGRAATLRDGQRQVGKFAQVATVNEAAAAVNVSPRSVKSARLVLDQAEPEVIKAVESGRLAVSAAADLARLPAETQRTICERVGIGNSKEIRPGLVRALVKQATKAAVGERLNAEPPPMPAGPYRVIVADPPWPYEKRAGDATHRGDLPYPSMPIAAICALDVAALAHPGGCILWLWTTNAFMRDAFAVLDAWGFREKTILTWAKDRIGLGDWLRGQTEHCILAVRGHATVTLTNETTLLHGQVREHSRKPDSFYSMVEGLCPGAKVEMFARSPRDGWAVWGAETTRFGS